MYTTSRKGKGAGNRRASAFCARRLLRAAPWMTVAAAVILPAMVFSAARADAGSIHPFAAPASPVEMGPLLFTAKNWAGYVAESDFSSPVNDSVTVVSGSWIVPQVTPSVWPAANVRGQESDCAVWVGIDGFSNSTVEQIGTESYVYNGAVYYDVWYEMYPNTMIAAMNVSPGDSVTASVQYSPPGHPNQFQLSLTDNTTQRQPFTTYQTPPAGSIALRSSAEWITEAPSSGGILPLPTFGSTTFTAAQATIGSTTGGIDDPAWEVTQVNMCDNNSPSWIDSMVPAAVTTVGSGASASSSFTVIQTPEPSTLAGLAAAAAVLALWRSRRHGSDKP